MRKSELEYVGLMKRSGVCSKKPDHEGTDDTYGDWRKSASSLFCELREAGQDVIKVSVKTNKFLAWCEERGLKPVQSSRSEYAAYLLEQR